MAYQGIILCDSDVIFENFKGKNTQVINELQRIGQSKIAISVVTAGEMLHGARDKPELGKIQAYLGLLSTLSLDAGICQIFVQLMSDYSLSHRIKIQDALIAATALFYDIPLYTLNVKDFSFIAGLKLHP